MVENPKFCEHLLEKDDFCFLKTLVTTQISQFQQLDQNDFIKLNKDAAQNYKTILNSLRNEISKFE
jgi:hypothetical protein